MGELASLVRKHPELIGVAVVAVALLAWWQSRGQSSGGGVDGDVVFVGGGSGSGAVDPGVVAIEEARIGAGAQNLGTLAQLVLGSQQSRDSLSAFERQTDANLTADITRTAANERTALAQTEAQRATSMAQIRASVDITGLQTSAATEAARISAATQAQVTAANLQAAGYARDAQNFQTQAGKDIARAGDNTSIVNNVIDGIVSIASGIWGWF